MLSYSTLGSGSGPEVERVARAVSLVKEWRPDLAVEGPIQYDAAISPAVAKQKVKGDSAVAGKATVFVFPDLNTGNNTYKALSVLFLGVSLGRFGVWGTAGRGACRLFCAPRLPSSPFHGSATFSRTSLAHHTQTHALPTTQPPALKKKKNKKKKTTKNDSVQQASGAVAMGPILQGLLRPVNDLSRGCTVRDVVSTITITSVQAQQARQQQAERERAAGEGAAAVAA
jgi:hypothetical protein